MFHILVVEDDAKLLKLFSTILEKNGYKTSRAENGSAALEILDKEYIDLMVCDVMMPLVDGYELTKSLRDAGYTLPILMVTARDSYPDKEKGFIVGVDDYMVKPIDINEMLLRISALLRRAKIANDRKITCGRVEVDYDSLTIKTPNGTEQVPQKEFFLLYKLLSYVGKIFTRQQLMDEIWGMDSETDPRTVDVHINRLRERLKEVDDFEIATVRGLGYKVIKK